MSKTIKIERAVTNELIEEFERITKKHGIQESELGVTALHVCNVLVAGNLFYTFQNDKDAMYELIDMQAETIKETVQAMIEHVSKERILH